MHVELKQQPIFSLNLTVKEAIFLKLLVQNAHAEYEDSETTQMRELFWNNLPDFKILYELEKN